MGEITAGFEVSAGRASSDLRAATRPWRSRAGQHRSDRPGCRQPRAAEPAGGGARGLMPALGSRAACQVCGPGRPRPARLAKSIGRGADGPGEASGDRRRLRPAGGNRRPRPAAPACASTASPPAPAEPRPPRQHQARAEITCSGPVGGTPRTVQICYAPTECEGQAFRRFPRGALPPAAIAAPMFLVSGRRWSRDLQGRRHRTSRRCAHLEQFDAWLGESPARWPPMRTADPSAAVSPYGVGSDPPRLPIRGGA